MNALSSIVAESRKLMWFIERPEMLPVLARKAAARVDTAIEQALGEPSRAFAWCEKNERSIEDTLATLQVQPAVLPQHLREDADRAVANVPMRMGGGGYSDLLYALSRDRRNALETGVAYGWSSLAILAGQGEGGRLVSIDLPYAAQDAERFVGVVVPNQMRSRWTLLAGADRSLLPAVLGGVTEFDLVHYDSDKSVAGRRWAYPLIWNKLKDGGLFVSDDISDNLAFARFAEAVGRSPLVVRSSRRRFVGILVK